MTDELTLSGKRFISSKRAAEETGYAQDYVGQLARSGAIDAQRVGGLWYVALDSLNTYNSKEKEPEGVLSSRREIPSVTHSVHNEFVSFDGKDYISASRASDLTGYNQDYVGQLARSGKILSRQIGKRWYVERSGIVAHKEQKDALLAAVQAQAVGMPRVERQSLDEGTGAFAGSAPVLSYIPEPEADLLPRINVSARAPDIYKDDAGYEDYDLGAEHEVPIRVHREPVRQAFMRQPRSLPARHVKNRKSHKAVFAGAAMTVVVVLSFGLSLFDSGTKFASLQAGLRSVVPPLSDKGAMLGAASAAFERYVAFVERVLVPESVYKADRR